MDMCGGGQGKVARFGQSSHGLASSEGLLNIWVSKMKDKNELNFKDYKTPKNL